MRLSAVVLILSLFGAVCRADDDLFSIVANGPTNSRIDPGREYLPDSVGYEIKGKILTLKPRTVTFLPDGRDSAPVEIDAERTRLRITVVTREYAKRFPQVVPHLKLGLFINYPTRAERDAGGSLTRVRKFDGRVGAGVFHYAVNLPIFEGRNPLFEAARKERDSGALPYRFGKDAVGTEQEMVVDWVTEDTAGGRTEIIYTDPGSVPSRRQETRTLRLVFDKARTRVISAEATYSSEGLRKSWKLEDFEAVEGDE